MTHTTQQDKILKLLEDGEFHGSLEMRNDLYIMQPNTRIFELKRMGYEFEKKMLPSNPNNPMSARIAWYRLIHKTEQKSLFNEGIL